MCDNLKGIFFNSWSIGLKFILAQGYLAPAHILCLTYRHIFRQTFFIFGCSLIETLGPFLLRMNISYSWLFAVFRRLLFKSPLEQLVFTVCAVDFCLHTARVVAFKSWNNNRKFGKKKGVLLPPPQLLYKAGNKMKSEQISPLTLRLSSLLLFALHFSLTYLFVS